MDRSNASTSVHSLDFNNTEIAFSGMSNYALRQAYLLFKVINNPFLAKVGPKMAAFSMAMHLPVKGLIKASVFRQFCGGESIDECRVTVAKLWKNHIGTILDYSVEGKETEADFDHCEKELLNCLNLAKGNPALPFCVFKVTGLGPFALLEKVSLGAKLTADEAKSYERVHRRIKSLAMAALDNNVRLLVDAEESWIQPAIDQFALEMMRLCNKEKAIIFNTAQMYRTESLGAIQSWLQLGKTQGFHVGVKAVRGAYMEKENKRAQASKVISPIYQTKKETDEAFDAAVSLLLDHISHAALCAGTHNEQSSLKLAQELESRAIRRDDPRIYFAQLLGMSDHISFNLAHHGFNVAKYVPYGPVSEVLPYLSRRAAENTSVQGQSSRELGLLQAETTRRGLVVI